MGKLFYFKYWSILNINLFLEIIDDFQGGIGYSEVRGGQPPQGGGLTFQGGIGTPLHAMGSL